MPEKRPQFQVLTTREKVRRLDALRIVMGVSRAKVIDQLLDLALATLESSYADRLSRLRELGAPARLAELPSAAAAKRARGAGIGQGWRELVDSFAERNSRKTYGETLEELEGLAGVKTIEPAPISTTTI